MIQEISDKFWHAEARTEETKRFIRDIKRIACRKFTAEQRNQHRDGLIPA